MNRFDQEKNQRLKAALPYIRNVYTSLFASVASLIFSFIILNGYSASYRYNEIYLASYAAKAFLNLLYPVVVVFTVALVYSYFDNLDLFNKRDYFDGNSKKPLVARKPYLVSFAISMLFSTLILTHGYDMTLSFFFPKINIAVARLLAVITMAIMRLVQLWSLQDKWETEIENPLFVEKALFNRNRDMYKFKARQLIWQPIGYFVVFALTAAFTSFFGFPLFLVIFNLITSAELWWSIFSIPLIIAAVIYTVRFIHNSWKRNILIKKLKQMERERLATVKIKGAKYLSATFTRLPLSVEIRDNAGKVYHCIVATNGSINAPMYFKPDEYMVEHGFHLRGGALLAKAPSYRGAVAIDISKMSGKENPTNMIFGFRMAHKLNFPDAEGNKVVILNPTPTTAFAVEGREYRSIDTGENMTNYTIYTASGLFNHIERQSRKGQRDYEY